MTILTAAPITATVVGGTPPYTYSWSDTLGASLAGATTATCTAAYTPAADGTYSDTLTCMVTDSLGETASSTATVIYVKSTPALAVTASPSSESASGAYGTTLGASSITATATGGVGPYTYAWSSSLGSTLAGANGATVTPSYTNGTPGTYTDTLTCTATDSEGHTATTTSTVSYTFTASSLSVGISPSSTSASGAAGAALASPSFTASASGGVSPYTYTWAETDGASDTTLSATSGATVSATINNSTAGSYTRTFRVTATDSDGHTATAVETVNFTLSALNVAVAISPSSTSASGTAGTALASPSFTASASGGAGPYTYAWSEIDGATDTTLSATSGATVSATINNSTAGTYTRTFRVTATDSQGNVGTATETVTYTLAAATSSLTATGIQPQAGLGVSSGGFTHSYNWTTIDGFSTLGPFYVAGLSGGTGPFTFAWTLGANDNTFGILPSDSRFITYNDSVAGSGAITGSGTPNGEAFSTTLDDLQAFTTAQIAGPSSSITPAQMFTDSNGNSMLVGFVITKQSADMGSGEITVPITVVVTDLSDGQTLTFTQTLEVSAPASTNE